VLACAAGAAGAQGLPSAAPAPTAATATGADDGPVELTAREIRGRPDQDAVAEGRVLLRRGALELQADWLSYEQARDLAVARGHVSVRNAAGHYSGTELQLQLERFEGFFLQPRYEFDRLQAGGRAERIDFIDNKRSVAHQAWYTSCPRDDGDRPAWVLHTDRVQLDFERNEGVAEGAVLRFMDVPILALPTLSFPLGDGRKTGWLPPTVDFDTRSGLSVAVPWYWNIAPNRDATLTPQVITRRGLALDSELRYLEPTFAGRIQADLLPHDRVAGRSRWALSGEHDGALPLGGRWHADGLRVSDDDWWKDFPKDQRSFNARLLPLRLEAERDLSGRWGQGLAYARMLRWQVLQGSDVTVISPYERAPQVGVQLTGRSPLAGHEIQVTMEAEVNRFVLPDRSGSSAEPTGWRAHTVGTLSLPWRRPGVWVVPRLSVNAASYALDQALADGRTRASRVIPSMSVEAGLEFERDTTLFGRALRQTLEPRALYVNTPLRQQAGLPNFDSAGKDFNFNSIFSDNAFSGVDRVSDAHQLTAGVTTRLIDAATGAEALRLGVVQRYLLRTQQVTPEGVPYSQRFSDIFLLGSTTLAGTAALEAALQYSPDLGRPVRTIVSARWNPGEFRTVSTTYRFTRGLAEQLEVGWQWPIWKSAQAAADAGAAGAAGRGRTAGGRACSGTWYAVGRVNYSVKDSRVTDSILGLEYDAGCWIMRMVAERLSTGRSEATTHVQLQLELVGLSRLGSNPLRVLKDNIPGYRLLRDERSETIPAPPRYD
jgi:LPS-assembly protein